MMLQRAYIQQIGGVFFNAFLVGMVTLLICENITKADEVPAFFLKIAKIPTLPRVGRSDRFEDFFYKAEKHIPRIGRNSQQDETYTDLTKRRIDYPPKVDGWSSQNFPLAIEGPRELWRTLAGYSRDGSDDIENEVWHRKKRTETEPITTQEK
ncbi:uncharacterized protein LOC105282101 [Ooceraea biroi]|uniref:uncharacterized protein LOC105282101 n=1 Tax=Ooceraea biroi TaxID=2015173 RepID=UPI000F08667F|nr:uncharacterized protein LOC105282101 [Ooceraea biroi]XP_026827106.1 uncharacterized protein LOC105282101 [Ooceraea biroi]